MKLRNWLYPLLALIGIVLVASGSYELYPWQGAFVTGVGPAELVTQSGWHWHWPELTTVTRFDRRRHVFLSLPLPWTASSGETMRMRFLALWRVSNPAEYQQTLTASRKAAEAAIEAQVRERLDQAGGPATRMTGPRFKTPMLSASMPRINRALAHQGIHLSRLRWAALRWPAPKMKTLAQKERERWTAAEAAIRAGERVELDRVRARAQAKLAALRLLETERSAEIVSTGLREASAIEARARHLDPRFYDFYSELMLYAKALQAGKGILLLSPSNPWFRMEGSHDRHR